MENEEVDPGFDSEIDDEEIWYTDDPVVDPKIDWFYKLRSFAPIAILLLVTTIYLPNTVGGKISLNSGNVQVEFGQGIVGANSCVATSGNLDLGAASSFNNLQVGGSFKLKSITIKGLPGECLGKDFRLRAYSDSNQAPLALYNTDSNTVIIQTVTVPATLFETSTAWGGASGLTIKTDSNSSLTITFTNPVADAQNVAKVTLESIEPYYVGDVGPAGGTVFYVSKTGFYCGSTYTARCKYLEVAPNTWSGGSSDPTKTWSTVSCVVTLCKNFAYEQNTLSNIGRGHSYTLGSSQTNTSFAQPAARAYNSTFRGIKFSDWHLPSGAELNQLCKFARGLSWTSDETACNAIGIGTAQSAASLGFQTGRYNASSQFDATGAWYVNFSDGTSGDGGVFNNSGMYVRPIRAF